MAKVSLKKLLTKILEWINNWVNNAYPVGSCYITDTNTNPGTWLGGTWSLVHKSFRSAWISTGFTWNTTNTTDGAFVAILQGNTIELRFSWKNNVAVSDSDVTIGTLTKSSIGISGGEHAIFPVGYCDGCNAIGIFELATADTGDGTLKVRDWVTRAASYPTTTGQPCYLQFVVNCRYNYMDDSFCDTFIWKRTA